MRRWKNKQDIFSIFINEMKEVLMLNIIKKSMLTGIGLALMAKDEVEDLAKELVKKSKMPKQEGMKFLEDLQTRYDETQKKLEERVQQAVKEFMKKTDVVTGDELKGLKKEIRELKKAIGTGTDTSK
jgi:polyhydroxyalkanoate synthesis regulator phasin